MMAIETHVIDYINRHLRTAGWHAAQMRAGVAIHTKSAADDFVAQADTELDVLLTAALTALLPDCTDHSVHAPLTDGLITEESIGRWSPALARAVAARPRVWYLDAIDGTDNYVKEDGQYTVMLGLVVGGEPVYGWLYAPARDELYFGGPPSAIADSFGYAGLWRKSANSAPERLTSVARRIGPPTAEYLRVIMGWRDQRDNPHLVERINANAWVCP
jgi:3'(2'), 5'-bisphosphate nucleotidase